MAKIGIDDTIAAISTPPGEGGIGIVRISGKKALVIADKIFRSPRGKRPSRVPSYTTHYGHIVAGKKTSPEIVDEVILTVMRAPASYTREDVVEINCHGGIVPLKRVLELVLAAGARPAEPGEFTRRAFLNGRLDLAQAEAVLDVIRARTELSLRAALRQLEGGLSRRIRGLRDEIADLLSELEAAIDFPEEDVDAAAAGTVRDRAGKVKKELEKLLATADSGIVLREGILAVICGKPNVGKSSLMNALLGQDRVIVAPHPGTTRDAIEEVVNVRGVALRLVDTAGIAETVDPVEKESVERSRRYLEGADLILLVLDGSAALDGKDRSLISRVKEKPMLAVINKTDLPQKLDAAKLRKLLGREGTIGIRKISALTGSGLEELEQAIVDRFWQGGILSGNEEIITSARHRQALREAKTSLSRAIAALKENRPPECAASDLRETLDSLGEIVGETTTEDVLDRIFERFCIGK